MPQKNVGEATQPPQFQLTEFPEIGNRIRVAIYHREAWRPLLWLRVGNDGSIYTGTLLGRPSSAQIISKEVPGSQIDIKYDEGQQLFNGDVPKSSRVSFKASGEIHGADDNILQGVRLETLAKQTQLCLFMFVHPARYLPPLKKQDNDYDVGIQEYPVDEDCPMYGALYVAPWNENSSVPLATMDSMSTCVNLGFVFRGLTRTPDLVLQFLIGHGLKGDWPEYPGIIVLSKKPD